MNKGICRIQNLRVLSVVLACIDHCSDNVNSSELLRSIAIRSTHTRNRPRWKSERFPCFKQACLGTYTARFGVVWVNIGRQLGTPCGRTDGHWKSVLVCCVSSVHHSNCLCVLPFVPQGSGITLNPLRRVFLASPEPADPPPPMKQTLLHAKCAKYTFLPRTMRGENQKQPYWF